MMYLHDVINLIMNETQRVQRKDEKYNMINRNGEIRKTLSSEHKYSKRKILICSLKIIHRTLVNFFHSSFGWNFEGHFTYGSFSCEEPSQAKGCLSFSSSVSVNEYMLQLILIEDN